MPPTDQPEWFHVAKISQHTPYIEPFTPAPLLSCLSVILSRLPQIVPLTTRFVMLGDTASEVNPWLMVIRRMRILLAQCCTSTPVNFPSTSVRAGKYYGTYNALPKCWRLSHAPVEVAHSVNCPALYRCF